MEWKSWLLLYIHTWIFQIFKISTFLEDFRVNFGTQILHKRKISRFFHWILKIQFGGFKVPKMNPHPKKTSSHTDTEVGCFVGYVLLGVQSYRSSVSVFGGCMSRGTEREKPTVVRGTSTTSEGHSNWWQLGWSNLTWAPWKWFFSVDFFLMTKK